MVHHYSVRQLVFRYIMLGKLLWKKITLKDTSWLRGHQCFSFIRSSLHTRNPALLGSSYALTTAWIYFSVVWNSYSRPCLLLNSQLVDLCKLGFFILLCFISIILFLIIRYNWLEWIACNVAGRLIALYFHCKKNLYLYLVTGAPNENIVQNHLNLALLNVF